MRKILYYLLTVFISVSLIFILIRLAPGDPVEKILGPNASYQEVENYRVQLGLDLSIARQYFGYMRDLVQLKLGDSLFKRESVVDLIRVYFAPSLILAFLSVLLSFCTGSFIGVLLALNRGTWLDHFLRVVSLLGLAFPIFSLAPVLVLIFSIKLQILPVSEWGQVKHVVLPVLTLSIPLSAILIRVVRNRFLDDLTGPWVQVLAAKGLNRLAIILRVFKVTLPTVLNIVAVQLSVVLAGTIITETIYDIPGIGLLLFEGTQNRDYPLVQGVMVFITTIYLTVYFVIEWLNEAIDPRIV